MAALYSDENIPASLVNALTALGHDVLTAETEGRANRGIADAVILIRATALGRIVLTYNRWDFHRLHAANANHAGIVSCTDDPDRQTLAQRIDVAIRSSANLAGQLIKITKPSLP